ncbi:MAG: aminotransferase class III-fold pyridoxal phosphate-dependent enzyme [Acidobacteriota bacterium]
MNTLEQQAVDLATEIYGLTATTATALPGEMDQNFRLETQDGRRFILKIAADERDDELLDLENAALRHLALETLPLRIPRLVEPPSGPSERVRLLTWVDGRLWVDVPERGPALRRSLGAAAARLDRALATFHHPVAIEREHDWDLRWAHRQARHVSQVAEGNRQALLDHAFQQYSGHLRDAWPTLPPSVIHGDLNDYNVTVDERGESVFGLFDFGDLTASHRVCEVAIAAAYGCLGEDDPVAAALDVLAGYHQILPLEEDEIAVFFPLVCARLAVSLVFAARRRAQAEGNEYLLVTEKPAWTALERLAQSSPAQGEDRARGMCERKPAPGGGQAPDSLSATRKRRIGPSLGLSYRQPLKIVRGRGPYLFDHRGRPFLDLVNNVCHVGHAHPRVVEAAHRQMARLNTNTRYLYDGLTDYADRLASLLPEPLEVCYFVNSGSEANELALRLARTHTARRRLLVMEGGYHGHTEQLIGLSHYKFLGKGGAGAAGPDVSVVPAPDAYRGRHRRTGGPQDADLGRRYGEEVGRVIEESNDPVAAFLCESLLSCGGQVEPPAGYLADAFERVRAAGGVCIADEVQVGFGRVGEAFWGFGLQSTPEAPVVPDIVVLGKPIGNGHPMAAVVTRREFAESFATGMEFFCTFGGNPVSCAVGLAVLDVIEEEGLQENARVLGGRFLAGLRQLAGRHPLIGDVRGRGLFLGLELVRDRHTLEPAAEEASAIVEEAKKDGFLLSTDGPLHNVIKIKPPMVLTADDVDRTLRALDRAFAAHSPS